MGTFFRKGKKHNKDISKKLSFYVTTDISDRTISIGKGRKIINFSVTQAKLLNELLNHQIQLLSDK